MIESRSQPQKYFRINLLGDGIQYVQRAPNGDEIINLMAYCRKVGCDLNPLACQGIVVSQNEESLPSATSGDSAG